MTMREKKDGPVPPPSDDSTATEGIIDVSKGSTVSFKNVVEDLEGVEADDVAVISSVIPISKDEADVRTDDCDLDENPTNLYLAVHGRNWTDSVFWSVTAPKEAATWVSRKDKKGTVFYRHLPLHAAITYHAPDRTIESLLRAFPQSAKLYDHKGKLPIHIAIKTMCSPGTIKRLLLGYPEAVDERDVKGRTLLYLIKSTMSKDREAYLNAWGAAFLSVHASVDFDTNPSPLYTLLSQHKWDEVRKRCEAHPEEVRYWTVRFQADCKTIRWKMLPLHAAIIFGAPYGVVNTILKAYPLAASLKDDLGALPIHLGAKLGAHPNVFDLLILAYPQGLEKVDSKLRLVRDFVEKHDTHWKGAHIESIDRGTAYWSNYKECYFDENPTNLYRMIHKKKWQYAINLAEGYPEEAQTWVTRFEKNAELRWKMLPIHAAIVFNAPLDVVSSFAKIYPSGLNSRDDLGRLPIHVALKNEAPPDVVQLLVKAYPECLTNKDRKGRTPLALAAAANNIEYQEEYIRILSKDSPRLKALDMPSEENTNKEENDKAEEREPEQKFDSVAQKKTTERQNDIAEEKISSQISSHIEVRDDAVSVSTLGQDSYVKRTRDDLARREPIRTVSKQNHDETVEYKKLATTENKELRAKRGKRKSMMKRFFMKHSSNGEKKDLDLTSTTATIMSAPAAAATYAMRGFASPIEDTPAKVTLQDTDDEKKTMKEDESVLFGASQEKKETEEVAPYRNKKAEERLMETKDETADELKEETDAIPMELKEETDAIPMELKEERKEIPDPTDKVQASLTDGTKGITTKGNRALEVTPQQDKSLAPTAMVASMTGNLLDWMQCDSQKIVSSFSNGHAKLSGIATYTAAS